MVTCPQWRKQYNAAVLTKCPKCHQVSSLGATSPTVATPDTPTRDLRSTLVEVGAAVVLAVFAASFFIAALLRAHFDATLYLQACVSDEGLEGAPGRVASSLCAPFDLNTPVYFLVVALLLAVAAGALLFLARPRRPQIPMATTKTCTRGSSLWMRTWHSLPTGTSSQRERTSRMPAPCSHLHLPYSSQIVRSANSSPGSTSTSAKTASAPLKEADSGQPGNGSIASGATADIPVIPTQTTMTNSAIASHADTCKSVSSGASGAGTPRSVLASGLGMQVLQS